LGNIGQLGTLFQELVEEELSLHQCQNFGLSCDLFWGEGRNVEALEAHNQTFAELVEEVVSALALDGFAVGVDTRDRVRVVARHARLDLHWVLDLELSRPCLLEF